MQRPKALQWIVILFCVLLVALGGWWWFQHQANQAQQPILNTVTVTRGVVIKTILATGRIIPNFEVEIKAKASGTIVKLPYDVSDAVNAGDILLTLDPLDESRSVEQAAAQVASLQAQTQQSQIGATVAEQTLNTQLARAQATIASAQAKTQEAALRRQRLEQLLKQDIISKNEYDTGVSASQQAQADLTNATVRLKELQTERLAVAGNQAAVRAAAASTQASRINLINAQRRLSETKITSPIKGVVTSRNVQLGSIVASGISNVGGGTTLMTVADLSRLYVLASVDESDVGAVRVGQPVRITVDAFPNETFAGVVTLIATKGANVNNVITFDVKIQLTDAKALQLKPEMTANVTIEVAQKADVVNVANEAIQHSSRGATVQKIVNNDNPKKPITQEIPVALGIVGDTQTEIISGLYVGDVVVLDAEEPVSQWRRNGAGKDSSGQRNGLMGGGGGSRAMMRSMGR